MREERRRQSAMAAHMHSVFAGPGDMSHRLCSRTSLSFMYLNHEQRSYLDA